MVKALDRIEENLVKDTSQDEIPDYAQEILDIAKVVRQDFPNDNFRTVFNAIVQVRVSESRSVKDF